MLPDRILASKLGFLFNPFCFLIKKSFAFGKKSRFSFQDTRNGVKRPKKCGLEKNVRMDIPYMCVRACDKASENLNVCISPR